MNTVILVAALNSGLRNGIGHATLVSHESALDDVVSAKLAYCSGIVRDSEQEVTWGEQFVGLRSSSTQKTSGRDAPEVFLMWNVAISKLTGEQRGRIVEWLRQLSDDRADLIDECQNKTTNRTTMVSQLLRAWVTTHGTSFPVFGELPEPDSEIAARRPRGASRPVRRYVAGTIALMSVLCLVAWHFSHPERGESSADFPPQSIDSRPPDQGVIRRPDLKLSGFQQWMADVTGLEGQVSSQAIPYPDAVRDLLQLCQELQTKTFAAKETESAHDKLKVIAESLQRALLVEGEKSLVDGMETLSQNGAAFEEYRALRDRGKASAESLKDLSDINNIIPGAQIQNVSGQLEQRFCDLLLRVIADHCAVFRQEEMKLASEKDVVLSIRWIEDAKNSEFATQLKNSQFGPRIASVFEAFQCFDSPVRLEFRIESDDVPLEAGAISLEFVDPSGDEICTCETHLRRQSKELATATARVTEWQLWRCSRVRVTAPFGEIPLVLGHTKVNTYCWSREDVTAMYHSRPHNLRSGTAGSSRIVRVAITPQDQGLRSCVRSVEKVLSELNGVR